MLGPSLLFASAPFALVRVLSVRSAGTAWDGMLVVALVISGLSSLAVLGLLALGVAELFLN